MLSIFSHVYLPTMYFLWWGVCSDLLLIFQLDCSFSYYWILGVLCIFCITVPLSEVSFANIFSQSLAYLILLTMSFAEQKFIILIPSSLSIVSLMNCAFGIVFKKSLPNLWSSRFSLMLSSRSFIVLHFTRKSTTHFEFYLWRLKNAFNFYFEPTGTILFLFPTACFRRMMKLMIQLLSNYPKKITRGLGKDVYSTLWMLIYDYEKLERT